MDSSSRLRRSQGLKSVIAPVAAAPNAVAAGAPAAPAVALAAGLLELWRSHAARKISTIAVKTTLRTNERRMEIIVSPGTIEQRFGQGTERVERAGIDR